MCVTSSSAISEIKVQSVVYDKLTGYAYEMKDHLPSPTGKYKKETFSKLIPPTWNVSIIIDDHYFRIDFSYWYSYP